MGIVVELVKNPARYVPTVSAILIVQNRELEPDNQGESKRYYWRYRKYLQFFSVTPKPPELVTDQLFTEYEVLRAILHTNGYVEKIVLTEQAYLDTFKALFDAPAVSHSLIAPMNHTRGVGSKGGLKKIL